MPFRKSRRGVCMWDGDCPFRGETTMKYRLFRRPVVCAGVPWLLLALAAAYAARAAADAKPADKGWTLKEGDGQVTVVSPQGRPFVTYQTERPADSKLPVESGCYFHPLYTPQGTVVTDVAPADHPHHRGVFLAWVEMHGKKDADFWGWGEHAPVKDRRIISDQLRVGGSPTSFEFSNDWTAEGETLLEEKLSGGVRATDQANVLDLTYTLTPTADLKLSRWAFSGFCVRTRKEGKLTAFGPGGEVKLPDPSHVKPESDWPAAAWYGYTLTFDDGKVAGVAVIDHPRNPPSLWHNHRGVRMLNPCIVAPAAVELKAGKPLVLRYRVVAHDGPTPRELLDRLAKEWAEAK